MEKKNRRIIFNKVGGNAGKKATSAKISLPKSWVTDMGLDAENRDVIITFKDNKIIIEKLK